MEEAGQKASAPERAKIQAVDALNAPQEPPRKKKTGPKGPNPLSMKKKKPKVEVPRVRQGPGGGKGKERAVGRSDIGEDGSVEAGAKRKRQADRQEEDDHAWDVGKIKGYEGESEGDKMGGGHKRKRRRKATAQAGGADGTATVKSHGEDE